jgi:hypothetical protein
MPNWCENIITITPQGEHRVGFDKIRELLQNEEEEDWMNLLVPREGEAFTGPDWYNNMIEYYGSKWWVERSDCHAFEIEEYEIRIQCDSAWSPLRAFCSRVRFNFGVHVRIEFLEPGCDFGGYGEYGNKGDVEWIGDYQEAVYVLDPDRFFLELENHYLEYHVAEGLSYEDVLARYPFLTTDEEKTEVLEMYNLIKSNHDN